MTNQKLFAMSLLALMSFQVSTARGDDQDRQPSKCIKKIFASLKAAKVAFGLDQEGNASTFLGPASKYTGTVDLRKLQISDEMKDLELDAWEFMIGSRDALNASRAGNLSPDLLATGSVSYALDRKTHGNEVCRLIEFQIQPKQ